MRCVGSVWARRPLDLGGRRLDGHRIRTRRSRHFGRRFDGRDRSFFARGRFRLRFVRYEVAGVRVVDWLGLHWGGVVPVFVGEWGGFWGLALERNRIVTVRIGAWIKGGIVGRALIGPLPWCGAH
jgi:hypothetical protein